MITSLIKKLIGTPASRARKPAFGKRAEIPASAHGINPELVDAHACDVVRTLQQAGFDAYIVGGAVRDLLVGLRPKDFDVATNATPEEVKQLFRRAFIIGRRFRIVHVVFGRGREHEVIEVSTFRAYLDAADAQQVRGNEKTSRRALEGVRHAVDASGRVLRDNVWGRQDEDAARRDFSINAMYYDPSRRIVVDYHQGMKDVHKRTIRMIGDAATRYREDPVRIIRAVRFAAKLAPLGFALNKATAAPLQACLPLLADVPQSRLFDEMLKLLQTGHAMATIEQLRRLGLHDGIYPLLTLAVERAAQPFVRAALQDTDQRVAEGKPCAPSFLLACLLWQDVRDAWAHNIAQQQPPFVALQTAIDDVFDARIGDVSGRGKLAADMREIWMMQPRFDKRTGRSPFSLVAQLRYRAGFDFLRLRAQQGEVDDALVDWWQAFQSAGDTLREDMIADVRQSQQQKKTTGSKRPRRKPRTAPDGTGSDTSGGGHSGGSAGHGGSSSGKVHRVPPARTTAPSVAAQTAAQAAPQTAPAAAQAGGEAPPRKRRRAPAKPSAQPPQQQP